MTCDFVREEEGKTGVDGGGYLAKGRAGVGIWHLFLEIFVTVGFSGCVHVSLQPSPLPMFFFMRINPDSRGQCAGEIPLLLSNQSHSISFLSLATNKVLLVAVLLFQGRVVSLELIRGTKPQACMYCMPSFSSVCVCMCACICIYLKKWSFFGLQSLSSENRTFTNQPVHWQLTPPTRNVHLLSNSICASSSFGM